MKLQSHTRAASRIALVGIIAAVLVVAGVVSVIVVNQPSTVRIELGANDCFRPEHPCPSGKPFPTIGIPLEEVKARMEAGEGPFDWFTMDDQINPTITVKRGSTVEIILTNNAGIAHDFTIDEFEVTAVTTRVSPGDSITVTFLADKIGTFTYYCSVLGHKEVGMQGSFVVI